MHIRVGTMSEMNQTEFITTACGCTNPKTPKIDPAGHPASPRNGFKVYVVSYTNKTYDMEAIFEISCFQSTQNLKCTICYPYGPTKLQGKV